MLPRAHSYLLGVKMSYNNSREPVASLGGAIILLFLIVALATAASFSTGLAGPTDRRITVVLPAVDQARGL